MTRTSGPGPRRGPRQAPAPQEIQLPLDLGLLGDGELVATGLPELTTTERVRNELDILGSRRPRARRRGLPAAAAGPRGHVLRRAAPAPQRQRAAGRRGEGRDPDPADPLRPSGRLPDPRRQHRAGRRDVLRGCAGTVRRGRVLLAGCCWCAACCAGPDRGGSRCGRPARGTSPACWRSGAATLDETGRAPTTAVGRRPARPRDRRRRSRRRSGPAGDVTVHASGFRQSAVHRRPARRPDRRSCGTPAPAAPVGRAGVAPCGSAPAHRLPP